MVRIVFLVLLTVALSGCREEPRTLDSGLEGYDPDLVDIQRASCLKRGGRFGGGAGEGTFICYETTRDGNKSCRAADDCEGVCLARSRSCAPIKPLLGCNEVLGVNGATSTVCVE